MNTKFLEYHGLSVKEFLNALHDEHEFQIEPPIDVEKIVRLLDVKLDEKVDFNDISTAGSVSIKDSHARIWVNPLENDYEPRRRFTLAHEIGHLVLHIDPDVGVREFIDTKKTLNRKDSYWDSKEYEANNFAAQLLMPLALIKKHGISVIDRYKERFDVQTVPVTAFVSEMASLFKVSEPAMKYRLKNVGIIN